MDLSAKLLFNDEEEFLLLCSLWMYALLTRGLHELQGLGCAQQPTDIGGYED